jgi:hypothetical protein
MAVLSLPVVLLNERTDPDGGVEGAGGVVLKRTGSAGGVVEARVLLKSAWTPLAVLKLLVVLF